MKIKDICVRVTDGSHNPPHGVENSNYMMLSSKNIFDDRITFDTPRYLTQADFIQESKRAKIVEGDVLLTIVGTVGRSAVVDKSMPSFTLQRSVAVLHPKKEICSPRHLMYALQSSEVILRVVQKALHKKVYI